MNIQYENKYGTLELQPLEYRHVSTVLHATTPDDLKFDFETAEKIALITENRHIQLAFVTKPCRALVVHHESPDTVAVCRVHSLNFIAPVNAREEIERLARYQSCPL